MIRHASVIIAAAAVVATVAGCADSQPQVTVPVTAVDGFISSITSPETTIPRAHGLAVGPLGEAVVLYSEDPSIDPWSDSTHSGLALVNRDGTHEVIVPPGDPTIQREVGYRTWGYVSETTVAWAWVKPGAEDPSVALWDRTTHVVHEPALTRRDGERAGQVALPDFLTLTLAGDTLLWSAISDDGGRSEILAVSSQGPPQVLLERPSQTYGLGVDSCLSTPASPMLWLLDVEWVDTGDDATSGYVSTSTHAALDVVGLHPLGEEPLVRSATADGFYLLPFGVDRCRDDILTAWRDDTDTWYAQ